ncbi:LacI family DNA-binding transcriptional regulator [Raineyella fluvialis]|uniref:Substrate-binding domain-containing protein n=1 Tax=Raineyella fluvialis TaxID=2662261 RepID=A0A5Q2F7Q9_9ACTN|nr:LacI family DNA-binding transcriptional regulator [Raineyella fluvialis]QGF23030.1 substrate-binding domain-containing protein [Raineyella fluvialis]
MAGARSNRGPLLRDVAQRAGVSVGTVSNVLNNPEKVSPETLTRVQAAITELGFVPNAAARQLRAGRSASVGLLVLDVRNPFFTDLAAGVEEAAIDSGLAVILATSSGRPDREAMYLERFEQSRVDGVLVTPVGSSVEPLVALRDRGTPVILLDRLTQTPGFSSIAVDDAEGGRLGGQHLVDIGCRHIAFVGGPRTLEQVRNRAAGARRVAEAAGVDLTEILTTDMSADEGHRVGTEIAALPPDERPDGIFAGNDLIALAVLQALLSAGIRVPEEVAVLGYDDIPFAALATVPLSSIRQPSHLMGQRAMALLTAHLRGDTAHSDHEVFTPELIVRGTTAGHRRDDA